jgi:hypothetical protein
MFKSKILAFSINFYNFIKSEVKFVKRSFFIIGIILCTSILVNLYLPYTSFSLEDNVPPVITLNGDNPFFLEVGTAYIEPGYIAMDNLDGDITEQVTVSGSVYSDQIGTYILEYNVTDTAGNPAEEVTRTVEVIEMVDNTPPVVSNNSKNGTEDVTISFRIENFTFYYSDAENDPLVKIKITSLPENGLLKLNDTNVLLNQEILVDDLGGLTFEPAHNWYGSTAFTWLGYDGTDFSTSPAIMKINIASINDIPSTPGPFITPVNGEKFKGGETVTISWQPSTDEDGDTLKYELYYKNEAGNWLLIRDINDPQATSTNFSYTLPHDNTTNAQFRVKAYDGTTFTGWGLSPIFTVDSEAPVIPNLTITKEDGSDYDPLQWTKQNVNITLSGGTDNLTGFSRQYKMGDSDWLTGDTATISSEGITELFYRTIDGVGNTSGENKVIIKIDKSAPEDFPVILTPLSDSIIRISGSTIDANASSASGMHVAAYSFYNPVTDSWTEWTDNTTYELSGLSPNTQYSLKMKARDVLGNERLSQSYAKYTLAKDAQQINVSSRQNTILIFDIINSDDNGINPEHKIEVKSKGTGIVEGFSDFSQETTGRVVSGLTPGTEYEVWLTTRNGDYIENTPVKLIESIFTNRKPSIILLNADGSTYFVGLENITLSWNFEDLDSDEVNYIIQVGTSSGISDKINGIPSSGSTGLSHTFNINNKEDWPVGTYYWRVVANDGKAIVTSEEKTFIIVDNIPPVITLKGDNKIFISRGSTYIEQGATATDNYDGNISEKIEISGEVNTNIEGTYFVQYNVIDSSGNKASQMSREIVVIDKDNDDKSIKRVDISKTFISEDVVEQLLIARDYDKEVIFKIAENTKQQVILTNGSLRKLIKEKVNFVIKNHQVIINIPVDAIQVNKIASISDGSKKDLQIVLNINILTENLLDMAKNKEASLKPVSNIFEFSLTGKLGGKSMPIELQGESKVNVKLLLSQKILKQIDHLKNLNVYKFDENMKQWVYVRTKVDLVNQNTGFTTKNLNNKYRIMEYEKSFQDLQGHWAQKDIEFLACKYVVRGITEKIFNPESPITRAEFTSMLIRALGVDEDGGIKQTFKDVKPDTWYYGSIEAAFRTGIVRGISKDKFKPNEPITREQIAAMIIRALKISGYELEKNTQEYQTVLGQFKDKDKIASWGLEDMAKAVRLGIIKGISFNQIAPGKNATRAQGAVMINRLIKLADLF